MASIIDERGYNQGFKTTRAQMFRLHRRARAIVEALPMVSAPLRILELGCGTGELAYQISLLTHHQVTGVDLSEQFIQLAQSKFTRPNLNFICQDLAKENCDFKSNAYHAIVGNGILHHLYYRLDSTLPALHRWLMPGGKLVFWEPNLWNPYVWSIFSIPFLRPVARLEPDEMAFTPKFIREKLESAGFHAVHALTRDFLLPNTPDRLIHAVSSLSDVLDQIPMVNRIAQSIFLTAEKC